MNYSLFIYILFSVKNGYAQELFRSDYTFISETNTYYKISTLKKNWDNAKWHCEIEGGSLFYPEDEKEAKAVLRHWRKTQFVISAIFVGISLDDATGKFKSVDGRAFEDIYNKWGEGEPNNVRNAEKCVVMRPDGTYNDDHCFKIFPYICKMPLATVKWNSECHTPYADYKRDNDASRCYKFHLKPQSWMKALEACDAEQGYLAIINTQDEADFLVNITKNAAKDAVEGSFLRGFVHVGFNWFEDDWKTIGGETIQEAGYSTWGDRQPDGGNEELCGAMAYDGKLHDVNCQQHMCFFICELEVKAFSFLSEKFSGV